MMKRSNFFTLLLLVLSTFLVIGISNTDHSLLSWRENASGTVSKLPRVASAADTEPPASDAGAEPPASDADAESPAPDADEKTPAPDADEKTLSLVTAEDQAEDQSERSDTSNAETVLPSMEHTLFIGDSRTVGLLDYGQIKESDYFCSVGMSVFNVQTETISVPGTGKVTLNELLEHKFYDRIYIMLGINELGYPFGDIISKYSELIELVKENAPDASIFLQANLHVTKKRSDRDKIYNNTKINELNRTLSEFADQETVFYIDANELFDDPDGALAADKSADDTHPYGKYYVEWAQWIVRKTGEVLKED